MFRKVALALLLCIAAGTVVFGNQWNEPKHSALTLADQYALTHLHGKALEEATRHRGKYDFMDGSYVVAQVTPGPTPVPQAVNVTFPYSGINGQTLSASSFIGLGCVYSPSSTPIGGTFNPCQINLAGQILTYSTDIGTGPSNTFPVAGQYNSSPPTLTSGNFGAAQLDSVGNLSVNCKVGCVASTYPYTFTGGGTPASASAIGVVGVYNSSGATFTNGQTTPLQTTANGYLETVYENTPAALVVNPTATSTPLLADTNQNLNTAIRGNGTLEADVPAPGATPTTAALDVQGANGGNPLPVVQGFGQSINVSSEVTTATTTQILAAPPSGQQYYISFAAAQAAATESGATGYFETASSGTCGGTNTAMFATGNFGLSIPGTAGNWVYFYGGAFLTAGASGAVVPSSVYWPVGTNLQVCFVSSGSTIAFRTELMYLTHA